MDVDESTFNLEMENNKSVQPEDVMDSQQMDDRYEKAEHEIHQQTMQPVQYTNYSGRKPVTWTADEMKALEEAIRNMNFMCLKRYFTHFKHLICSRMRGR